MTTGWPKSWTRAIRGSLPLPCPLNVLSADCSHSGGCFQGHSLETATCFRGHLDGICDWTQVELLYKLLEFLIYSFLWLPNTRLAGRFSCLLKLPPARLQWPPSFSLLLLPTVCEGRSQVSPRELLWLCTNTWIFNRIQLKKLILRKYWMIDIKAHIQEKS